MRPCCRTIRFALVDVFTGVPLAGSPLAVVPDAEALDERVLARIAREFNQSETTFLLPATRTGADCRLRSFTPAGKEVFGPGHNALGAWWWLAASGRLALEGSQTPLHQELGERVLPLTIESLAGRPIAVAMHQARPVFGLIVRDRKPLAHALGLPPAALHPRELPPQVVSTGTPHLLVAVAPKALGALRPDREWLRSILIAAGAQGCYVFALTPERRTNATARFVNSAAGIPEEPATGSAAGPLAHYLRYYGAVDGEHVRIAQGAETGRPSELEVELRGDDVLLRGQAVVAAEGDLHVPCLNEPS
jgi:trans-2,3-dihydro-3-hydroxyanthranilate isomerase